MICTDCIFDQNNAVFGSSVFASNSAKLVLNRATVSDATSSNDAAVYANNGAELEIYDSEFTTNELTNAGEAATGLAVRSADLILERTSFTGHISGDRQPTILLSGFATSHQLTDVKLVDNDGGVWITGSAQVDLTGLVAYRNGGKITAEREGAVEVRNGGNIVTLYNAELAANDGPGLNISPTDPTSTVDVGWSTFVGNGEAGIAYTAAGGLTVNYSVFNFHTSDIAGPNLMSLTGPQENWYEHATSVFDHCATVYPAVCYSGDPQFLTFHPNLQSDRWVLRPEGQAGPLWNGAGNIFGAGDPFSIIGHSGGPLGDAMQWYADDGDGVRDGWELFWHGTTDNDGEDDVDGDGVDELTEYNRGTSPIHQDTDEDTYPDDCEELFGTNPQNPLSFPLSQCP